MTYRDDDDARALLREEQLVELRKEVAKLEAFERDLTNLGADLPMRSPELVGVTSSKLEGDFEEGRIEQIRDAVAAHLTSYKPQTTKPGWITRAFDTTGKSMGGCLLIAAFFALPAAWIIFSGHC